MWNKLSIAAPTDNLACRADKYAYQHDDRVDKDVQIRILIGMTIVWIASAFIYIYIYIYSIQDCGASEQKEGGYGENTYILSIHL